MNLTGEHTHVGISVLSISFRLNLQFRIDNDQTKFIDIELPAHLASFHILSLNIQRQSISGSILNLTKLIIKTYRQKIYSKDENNRKRC